MITREQFRRALVGGFIGALVGHTLGFFVLWPLTVAMHIPLCSLYCAWLLRSGFWLSGCWSLVTVALIQLAQYTYLDRLCQQRMGVPFVR